MFVSKYFSEDGGGGDWDIVGAKKSGVVLERGTRHLVQKRASRETANEPLIYRGGRKPSQGQEKGEVKGQGEL